MSELKFNTIYGRLITDQGKIKESIADLEEMKKMFPLAHQTLNYTIALSYLYLNDVASLRQMAGENIEDTRIRRLLTLSMQNKTQKSDQIVMTLRKVCAVVVIGVFAVLFRRKVSDKSL